MKARIASHGNKDRDKEILKTDSCTCPPTVIRLLLSVASPMKWTVTKIDFKAAFLQTGMAQRDVYVVPRNEIERKNYYWLLLTASYGVLNTNAKWQSAIDDYFKSLGFYQLKTLSHNYFTLRITRTT